jgi:hypothetical protein
MQYTCDAMSVAGPSPPPVPGKVLPAGTTLELADDLAELRREVEQLRGLLPEHVDVDPAAVEQGLAKLVLALVEFLRRLLERQAVRRMESGDLSDEEIERMGLALMRLEEKVHELARAFGLQPSDLNLDLGPLGTLL